MPAIWPPTRRRTNGTMANTAPLPACTKSDVRATTATPPASGHDPDRVESRAKATA